jgi:hypothetical protein
MDNENSTLSDNNIAICDIPNMNAKLERIDLVDSKKVNFAKFSQNQWNKIEKKYKDPMKNAVLDAMCKLGGINTKETQSNLLVCGNETYKDIVRKKLKQLKYVEEGVFIIKKKGKKKKKRGRKKKKKGMSKEEIIKQNTIRQVENDISEVVEAFKSGTNNRHGFSSKYVEIRLANFMHIMNHLMNNKSTKGSCYEIIIGSMKALNNVKIIPGISGIAIIDTQYNIDRLKEHVNFTYEEMFKRYPRLCISTKYDAVFPKLTIKPYDSQKQLMDAIKNHEQCLCMYNAMIGSGKTTVSIAIAKYIEQYKLKMKAKSVKSKKQLLFACSIEPVRHQVCMMAYNAKIPFGISVISGDKVRVINNYNCKSDDKRLIIVADLNSTIDILKRKQDYILFLDEPTVGADKKDHPITSAVIKILLNAPEQTILSSATLPNEEEMSG